MRTIKKPLSRPQRLWLSVDVIAISLYCYFIMPTISFQVEYDVSGKSIQRDLDFLQDDLHVIRKWTEKYKNNSGEVRSKPMCIELDVENLYRLTYPDGMNITKANEN